MNENSDLLPNLLHEEFEMQMRGYSRRQVDDFVARRNNEIRELEQRLARTLDDSEHLRRELSAVRQQALAGRPAHEEISERISQILKLADDEAKAQKHKADDEIGKQRAEAQQESERVRAEAREQAERMLTAAQEQAERTISAARADADKTRTTARTEADRLTSETRNKADAALAQAKAQAKRVLDEATARASAVHDGAERRLSLLSTRHAETVRRLNDILEGVQGLVTAEATRMSLEDEVSQTVSRAVSRAEAQSAGTAQNGSITQNGSTTLDDDDTPHDGTALDDDDTLDDATPESGLSLAMLAPPAPETVSASTAAPPRGDDRQPNPAPGRHTTRPGMPAAPEPPFDPFEASGPVGGGQQGGRQRPAMPMPVDDALARGLAGPFAERGIKRELPGRPGLIDPDEPTEGLRLLT